MSTINNKLTVQEWTVLYDSFKTEKLQMLTHYENFWNHRTEKHSPALNENITITGTCRH